MAAEVLATGGAQVVLAEAMPTPARKFLMAGKSGLNLTKDEPFPEFAAQIALGGVADACLNKQQAILSGFGPAEVQDWARSLGVDLFTGSTGWVFPREMKGSPLLRAWLARLRDAG
ncbi:MAG: NAD(P)/FAD-dependent oxidoreductase, partial [Paracoccus sp. (in: a-proteobacteria)]|nr:NAD(P)/FAD-dependent oxidoreductase [Paracoccus sp. (in: a-proteobacteria)]